ncbi:YigZ family protein [Halobacillus salinarum]|uniref:YigZ family protein n=1 Tax=Halobacillus salinarum TaxID=2932257 RepID=A0ABY4EP52_9BACI|nr:YigZ family protein [Halobacillus salinarum]UOQ45717.1 YigZ family protein [Halobacillus salinarum]
MLENYYTVHAEGHKEIVIQKSRFIGYVKRCETEEHAQAFIDSVKKKHGDANHNCSAYMIGEQNLIQKAHDDGEPSGTAGVPILEVLKRKDLKDTAVVVTRYFGGIKLGAGGLIRAYSSTAAEAIDATGIVERQRVHTIKIIADYTMLGKLENEIRNSNYHLSSIDYLEQVHIDVWVKTSQEEEFTAWITDLTSGQAVIETGEFSYMERPVE